MQRRRLLAVFAGSVLALALAGCGSDGSSSDSAVTEPSTGDTLPPVTDGAYTHPADPNDVVFEYGQYGGFTTREYAFQSPPLLLVSGDGRAFTMGPQTEIYPGPALPNILVRTITEAGIQALLVAANDAGLFATVDYTADMNVADVPTATVRIVVDGTTWTHEAYALGFMGESDALSGTESTPQRATLLAFTNSLGDLAAIVGADQLGSEGFFEPENYLVQATVVEDLSALGSDGIEPTVVEWPSDVSDRLVDVSAGAGACAVIPATDVGDVFTAANQLTLFTEAGVTYRVTAVQQLPGRTCP